MKLTPGVDFINNLRAVSMWVDLKNVKIEPSHHYLFALFGSVRVKAVCKMLMKSTPDKIVQYFSLYQL
jgi:hypothetical protein